MPRLSLEIHTFNFVVFVLIVPQACFRSREFVRERVRHFNHQPGEFNEFATCDIYRVLRVKTQ